MEAEEFKKLQERAGVTSKHLAKKLGVTETHISFMRTGRRKISQPLAILMRLFYGPGQGRICR